MGIEVTLSCSPAPREVFEQVLRMPQGATLADAVRASELPTRFPNLDWRHAMTPGIWRWSVHYSGDSTFQPVDSSCGVESFGITN